MLRGRVESLFNISKKSPEVIWALADFQRFSKEGIEISNDLIFLAYYRVSMLKLKKDPLRLKEYDKKKDSKPVVCSEHQCWPILHVAKNELAQRNIELKKIFIKEKRPS